MVLELIDDFSAPPFIPEPITRLREYQDQAASSTLAALREHRGVLAVLATGTGKTVLFAHLTKHFTGLGGRVLILAHTDELIEQARDKLAKVLGVPVAKEKADDRASLHDKVVVASVATLRGNRLRSWPRDHFALIVVDESHRVMAQGYRDILAHFEPAKVLGVTATATRGDKRLLRDVFSIVSFDYGIRKAVADGWLVRPVGKTMPLQVDLGKVETRGGDFVPEQLAQRLIPYLDEIARVTFAEIGALNRTLMVFLPSVATAQLMADSLRRAGFSAEAVWGDDPDRTSKIQRFKSGEIRAICNPTVLTEGFDHDAVDTILCLRPTKLVGLYTQICGRGTRPLAHLIPALNAASSAAQRRAIIAASPKPCVWILDFLYLFEQHVSDMMRPANLVAPTEEVARQMKNEGDLIDNEEAGERSMFEALEKALDEASKKKRKARTIDPFAAALACGDGEELNYEPMAAWEEKPISDGQRATLTKFGINLEKIRDRGHASRVLDWIFARLDKGLCPPRTLIFLKNNGIDASEMPAAEARKAQQLILKGFAEKRAGQKVLAL